MCPFPILGVLGGIVGFCPSSNSTSCKQTVESLIRQNAASGLGLHCLPMSHKKNARLIYNIIYYIIYYLYILLLLSCQYSKYLNTATITNLKENKLYFCSQVEISDNSDLVRSYIILWAYIKCTSIIKRVTYIHIS